MTGDRWDWNSAIINRLYSGVNAGVENSATSLMCRSQRIFFEDARCSLPMQEGCVPLQVPSY